MVDHEPYNEYMEHFDYEFTFPTKARSEIEVEAAMRLITCSCHHDGISLQLEAIDDKDCLLNYFLVPPNLDSDNNGYLDWKEISEKL